MEHNWQSIKNAKSFSISHYANCSHSIFIIYALLLAFSTQRTEVEIKLKYFRLRKAQSIRFDMFELEDRNLKKIVRDGTGLSPVKARLSNLYEVPDELL